MTYAVTKVVLTPHAKARCSSRKIDHADVRRVAMNPSMTWQDSVNESIVCSGLDRAGCKLTVCLVDPPTNGRGLVKTAYYPDSEEV